VSADADSARALDAEPGRQMLKPRRLIVEALGFLVGLALLIWCISEAVKGGDWDRVLHADPFLIAGLMLCTIVSLLANGAIFWLTVQPISPLRLRDMVLLNLVTSVLNYAPIRAGLIARIAYHLRVDRLTLVQIGAWLAAVGITLAATIGAVVAATLLRPELDWLWALLLAATLAAGGLLLGAVSRRPVVSRLTRGMEQMLARPACLWGAIGLRLIDVAAFAGRMACAVAILDLPLDARQSLLLAMATIVLTLFPLGRVGYREAGVALAASFIGMGGEEFDAARSQLALVESAGEAMVAIPLGAASLLWYRARWKAARRTMLDR
jgi:hypothetical protein